MALWSREAKSGGTPCVPLLKFDLWPSFGACNPPSTRRHILEVDSSITQSLAEVKSCSEGRHKLLNPGAARPPLLKVSPVGPAFG